MFKDLDLVVLTKNIRDHGLKKGDLGTIVHLYSDNKAMEVEFISTSGKTIAVLTLEPKDVRSTAKNEILHVRDISPTYSI